MKNLMKAMFGWLKPEKKLVVKLNVVAKEELQSVQPVRQTNIQNLNKLKEEEKFEFQKATENKPVTPKKPRKPKTNK